MRRRIVAANWKMNLLRAEGVAHVRQVRRELADRPSKVRVVIFPSFPLIPAVAGELDGCDIAAGGQDLHPDDKGAHTGDVSGAQLVDAGCSWVLCGHSERRQDHGETDELVARKVAAALRHGLAPMICVGETRDERKAGRTFEVLERQTRVVLASLGDHTGDAALAYEPVWAIGTGETATPEIAQEAHAFLRGLLGDLPLPILYGGSATPDNCPGLIAQPDLDGFLVGGASLDPGKFLSIILASG
ncbi:MAG TPA: triose-phosphate isomerase [Thermoanaerobaculia bacterium]|jgi:triosephosphate isomerase|nr:triose-phosphate isomerase [Thermoanaerobaculia bacterium]